MKKLLGLLKYEAKTIFRDPLNFYMCLFPLIILVLSGYVFPKIFGSLDLMQEVMLKAATMLFLIIILAFSSFFIGAMATFLAFGAQRREHVKKHRSDTRWSFRVSEVQNDLHLFHVGYWHYCNSGGH